MTIPPPVSLAAPPRVHSHADPAALVAACGAELAALTARCVAQGGQCHIALAGGGTPRDLYRSLARPPLAERMPWSALHLYWGDERCVPADHPESNQRMVRETLLDHVPLPAANIHPMPVELPPAAAAARYTATLAAGLPRDAAGRLRFDLVLLGLGSDGHTASLFPPELAQDLHGTPLCRSGTQPQSGQARLSIALELINDARQIWFLVTGAAKVPVVRGILEAAPAARGWPAAWVRPRDGELVWHLDRAAAGSALDLIAPLDR
ncbi:MAG: 6-phosphogluconolactonase [Magnetococcales bacterium]|nr:6-phosphogluconolactonase [Magnetococcales bacterium]